MMGKGRGAWGGLTGRMCGGGGREGTGVDIRPCPTARTLFWPLSDQFGPPHCEMWWPEGPPIRARTKDHKSLMTWLICRPMSYWYQSHHYRFTLSQMHYSNNSYLWSENYWMGGYLSLASLWNMTNCVKFPNISDIQYYILFPSFYHIWLAKTKSY